MPTITFSSVLDTLKNITFIVSFIGIFVEFTPIKFHPVSWIMNKLFRSLREEIGEVRKEINEVNTKVDELKVDVNNVKTEVNELKQKQQEHEDKIQEMIHENDMASIAQIRWQIIEFSNSIENGQLHTRDEFLCIKDNFNRYHKLIDKHKMTNGYLDEEMAKINKHYEETKGSSAFYI